MQHHISTCSTTSAPAATHLHLQHYIYTCSTTSTPAALHLLLKHYIYTWNTTSTPAATHLHLQQHIYTCSTTSPIHSVRWIKYFIDDLKMWNTDLKTNAELNVSSLMRYNGVKIGKHCRCRPICRWRYKCAISQHIAVRTSDVLCFARNVRFTAAGVRKRNGMLYAEWKVLRQCGSKWVLGNPVVPRSAWWKLGHCASWRSDCCQIRCPLCPIMWYQLWRGLSLYWTWRYKCVISQHIAVRTSDVLFSSRNVRFTAAGVREGRVSCYL